MSTTKEIRSLTGLRGAAATLVMFHHFSNYHVSDTRVAVFMLHLYLAVDLFFVLSGFVMAANYAHTPEQGKIFKVSLHNYIQFLGRRLSRIYPLYAFATIVGAVLIYLNMVPEKSADILGYAIVTNIFLIAGWGIGPYIIGGPAWSISTEFAAYILFPILATVTIFKGKLSSMIAGAIAIATLFFIGSLPDSAFHEYNGRGGPLGIMEPTTIGPVIRCLCGFTLGLLAYRISKSAHIKLCLDLKFVPEFLACTILVLLFGRTTDIYIVSLCVLLVAALSAENSFISRFLGSSVLHWLGVYSYSIYLIHMPVSLIVERSSLVPLLAKYTENSYVLTTESAAIKIMLSLLLSYITYNMIEHPGRVALNNMLKCFGSSKRQI